MKHVLALTIMSAIGLQLLVSTARADDRYAKACIANETHANINYSWKFGNEAWKQKFISPGQQDIVSYEYGQLNQDHSPFLDVRYDAEINGHKVESKQLSLYRAAGNGNCNQAKMYAFRPERSDANFISLVPTN